LTIFLFEGIKIQKKRLPAIRWRAIVCTHISVYAAIVGIFAPQLINYQVVKREKREHKYISPRRRRGAGIYLCVAASPRLNVLFSGDAEGRFTTNTW